MVGHCFPLPPVIEMVSYILYSIYDILLDRKKFYFLLYFSYPQKKNYIKKKITIIIKKKN